ncbi:MAG TPA: UDP-N-acetylmuramoyl-tripeptide--D-alanyl-D-alanine ligase [bacterium]|nr:UDP-N-acetylmuramoyl-tripeptide--D-alanyl-D-alanine ligase [bacterium]HQL61820.1 UDP-N-acetylmuramoyl-tripeptide--D-alanyl-D-alanine ligase [bacterium]
MPFIWQGTDLLAATGGQPVGTIPDSVTGISTDSRNIKTGDLFVALRGERFDGHDYLHDARMAGAGAALIDNMYLKQNASHLPLPSIVVEDTLVAYGNLARYYRRCLSFSVAAITGSVGKSTTRRMVAHILQRTFRIHETKKNYNNLVGTPKTLLEANADTDIVVLEHGIDRPGEMLRLARISEPNVGIVVSVAPCHLERLGTLEGIATEKGMLLTEVQPNGWGIINLDSPFASYLQSLPPHCLCFSLQRHAPVQCIHVETDDLARACFIVRDPHGTWSCNLSAPGAHLVTNALAAWCVGEIYGVPSEERSLALHEFQADWGRLRRRAGRNGSIVLDDVYNANPVAFRAALDTLRRTSASRRIAVIGNMLELGPRSAEYHRLLGQDIPEYGIDYLFTLGDLALCVNDGAIEKGFPQNCAVSCISHEELVQRLLELIKPGDLILVKASRGMAFESVVERIIEFVDETD